MNPVIIIVTVVMAAIWVFALVFLMRGPRRKEQSAAESGRPKGPAVLWSEEEIREAKARAAAEGHDGAETLPDFDRFSAAAGQFLQFAVTIPLVRRTREDGAEELRVVFEKRADDLDRQPGEICLPGGARESGENAAKAAVRETAEELLVGEDQIRLLARMRTLHTGFGNEISVFLCELTGYEGTWSSDEVAFTFEVPLDFFLETEPDEYENRLRVELAEDFPVDKIPGGENYPWHMRRDRVVFYYYEDMVIWGLTGKIMKDAARTLREEPEAARLIGR